MFEHIKQRIIKSLIDEIECLDATNLELVGNNMLSVIETQRLIHHGINKDYKPSGYTVDTFSSDSSIIGEYSTEKEYFSDYIADNLSKSYKKIRKDINHALEYMEPSKIEKIYLICNHEEPPSFRSRFNKTDIFLDNRNKIIIYDSREMAKIIYQQSIGNVLCADFYKQFFPNYSQELDNFEYYGKVPSKCEKFCSEPVIIRAIENHYIQKGNICILFGLSGSGKTQATIDYVHSKKEKFNNYIWITGDDWIEDTSLSAVQRTRGGAPVNVAGIFNSSKTILIIDSIERTIDRDQFKELAPGFEKGSVVLATSQITIPGESYYLPIPAFSEEVALNILGEEELKTEITKSVVKKCKFSPLILATIRKMVELEKIDRESLYHEILDDPEEISGKDGSSIIRKVLYKLEGQTLLSLKKIANTSLTIFDIDFLRKFTSNLSCHKLQQLSIIMTTNTPGIVKIHDFICDAMKNKSDGLEVVNEVERYIAEKKGEMTPSVLRQIHLAYKLIYEYKRKDLKLDWLTYALLQVEGEEKNILTDAIHSFNFGKEMSLCNVMCLIEAKELYGYTIDNHSERNDYYLNCVNEYKDAVCLYDDIDIKTELLHHLGKTLRRCKEYDQSYETFIKLLEIKPHWYATYGQIVTLGTMKVSADLKNEGKKHMKLLLEDMLKDASYVPLRVSLATISRLRSYRDVADEMINHEKKVDQIAQIISIAALEDIGQFFEAFVAFSSIFSYHYGKNCLVLAESIPEMIRLSPEMIEERQWVNACEALVNIAITAREENNTEFYTIISQKGIEFADKIASKENINSYDARAVAKSYIKYNMPDIALVVIQKVPNEKQDHWLLYRKAEAEMLTNNSTAIESAKRAYKLLLSDKKNEIRKSSYLDLISKCHEKEGKIENALNSLSQAIAICKDEKYKTQMQQHMNILQTKMQM